MKRIATTNDTMDRQAYTASFMPWGCLRRHRSRPHPKVNTAKTTYVGSPTIHSNNTKEWAHETSMLIYLGSSSDVRGHLPKDSLANTHVA